MTAWVAIGIATCSLIVSASSVIVTVALWKRQGWAITVKVVQPSEGGWGVRITNTGRQACVVSDAGLEIGEISEVYTVNTPYRLISAKGLPAEVPASGEVRLYVDYSDLQTWRSDTKMIVIRGYAYTGGRRYDSADPAIFRTPERLASGKPPT